MSQEQVLKTLVGLGLDELEAKIYFLLAKKGTSKASEICRILKITKQQFYPNIKQLQTRGLVTSTIEHPARYNAMTFEQVLDLFIRERLDEAQQLQKSREDILSNWQNVKLKDETPATFAVIEGRVCIYNKIQQIMQTAHDQILAITTIPALAQADERDIFDAAFGGKKKSSVKFRFLADLNEQNLRITKLLLKNRILSRQMEGRTPALCPNWFPQMVVRDEEEALFFVKPRTDNSIIEKDDVCLWTDCKTLVKSFTALFEDAWQGSIDLKEKLSELENGKPAANTILISDAQTARRHYRKILMGAKEEIMAIVSSKGLLELVRDLEDLPDLSKEGVLAKIMAPLTEDSFKTSRQFPKFCSVRHIPPNYKQTIIIDGKYLFQLSVLSSTSDPLQFEKVSFITSQDYIYKTRLMLEEIWRNANPPSTENLKSLFGDTPLSQSAYFPGAIHNPGPSGTFYPTPITDPTNTSAYKTITIVNDDPNRKLTEKDILNEIIERQKSRRIGSDGSFQVYSTQAIAIIHPHDNLKLPPMLIRVHHIEKQSTFGEEDAIIVNALLETPTGPAYIPVAVISDSKNAQTNWGRHFESFPAGRNIYVAKNGELEVWVHGNTLFAAWTVAIPLLPSEYVLPPSCILMEGYGNVKTVAYTVVQPTGGKFSAKQNGLDAFVTFMHPSSKYSGPGTDGFLVRDFVMDVTPQFIEGFHPTQQVKLVERDK